MLEPTASLMNICLSSTFLAHCTYFDLPTLLVALLLACPKKKEELSLVGLQGTALDK